MMGSNFEYTTNLQYKVKHLTSQLESFLSGEKYVSMEQNFQKQLSGKNRKIKNLKSELGKAHCATVTVRKNWMEVFEDITKEHGKELRRKNDEIKRLNKQILELHQQLNSTKDKLKDKTVELYQVKTELEEEKGKRQKLKAQLNRDYENSSIPSSQKPNHKKISNSREKTDRKPGGQPGHQGHRRKRHTPTQCISIPAPGKYADSPDYKPTGKVIKKQVINIGISIYVDEYSTPEFRKLSTGQRVHANFPSGVVNEVNYGGTIKSFVFLMNNHYCVSIDKVREFLAELTDGELQISKGMINGLSKEFSTKTEKEQKQAFSDLLLSPVMNTDFTNARVNGKSAQVAICTTPAVTLYLAREHKGHRGVTGTPVEDYQGILVHDHDVTFYKYGSEHQECLSHVLRYLKNSIENEPNLKWNQGMLELIREMIHYRNGLTEEPDPDHVNGLESRYCQLLDMARQEYEYEPPSNYYREGYLLFKRLEKYQENHLLFLHDKRVPATNNQAERKARNYKRKQKQVMGFRSFDSFSYLCNSMSMMDWLRNKKENLFKSISDIFD